MKKAAEKTPAGAGKSSSAKLRPLYTPADLKGPDSSHDPDYPGDYPYTRGMQPTGYRGRL